MPSSSKLVAVGATAFAVVLTAACSLEVNVQMDRDEEGIASFDADFSAEFPANPFRADAPDAPTAAVEPAPDRSWPGMRSLSEALDGVEPSAPPVPLPPAPPLFQAPMPTVVDGAVRDALWRRDMHVESRWVEIPQPPETEVGPGDGPRFTPFTEAPRIANRLQVVEAVERFYPSGMKRAGIGGTVRVYFFIDEDGSVGDVRLDSGSGYRSLDEAAMRVAREYEFTPALNRGEEVAVWVAFPITFKPH